MGLETNFRIAISIANVNDIFINYAFLDLDVNLVGQKT